jgi:hypothetical protein
VALTLLLKSAVTPNLTLRGEDRALRCRALGCLQPPLRRPRGDDLDLVSGWLARTLNINTAPSHRRPPEMVRRRLS